MLAEKATVGEKKGGRLVKKKNTDAEEKS